MEQIIIAAGNFQNLRGLFKDVPGVVSTVARYSGGTMENPTYTDVINQTTGHAFVVLVEYEKEKLSTEQLVNYFFDIHDPTVLNAQGNDIGECYRSALFYVTDEQRRIIEEQLPHIQKKFEHPIVTEIAQAGPFYKAEEKYQALN